MFKRLTLLSIVGILCLADTANSQTKKDTSETSSSTVIIFNSGPGRTKTGSGENNIIKVAPLGFISGKIPVSYERRITDLLSIQLTGGLTSKNYTNAWWFNTIDDIEERELKFENFPLPDNVDDQTDPTFDYTNRKAVLGYMFSFQPRLYFENEGLEDSFIGLSTDFSIIISKFPDGRIREAALSM